MRAGPMTTVRRLIVDSVFGNRLVGRVYGDDRFADDAVVTTSPLREIRIGPEIVAITRSGTEYRLEGFSFDILFEAVDEDLRGTIAVNPPALSA